MKRIFPALLVAGVLLYPAVAQARVASAHGVSLVSCVVNQGGNGLTNGINVVYYNTRRAPIGEVDFLVRYHGSHAVLVDRGTFTHGAQINHDLTNALVSYVWYGPNPNLCTVQRIVLENGQVIQ
jgi:hypothetical protein